MSIEVLRTFALMLALALLLSCDRPEPSGEPQIELTLVGHEGARQTLDFDDLEAMATVDGWGGWLTTVGTIEPPLRYRGVAVEALCDRVGGLPAGTGARITAVDSYAMTMTRGQIQAGTFHAFHPTTGAETTIDQTIRPVLAWLRDGEGFDAESGPMRMALLTDDAVQVTDGHWWIKQVVQVEVLAVEEDWTLRLRGAIDEEMDRATFESGAAEGCHGATWTDGEGHRWTGIPLWLLVGWVDDDNRHRGLSYNRELAERGYDVEVLSSGGGSVSLPISRVSEDDGIILAYRRDGEPLSGSDRPLCLVGAELTPDESIGGVEELVLHLP